MGPIKKVDGYTQIGLRVFNPDRRIFVWYDDGLDKWTIPATMVSVKPIIPADVIVGRLLPMLSGVNTVVSIMEIITDKSIRNTFGEDGLTPVEVTDTIRVYDLVTTDTINTQVLPRTCSKGSFLSPEYLSKSIITVITKLLVDKMKIDPTIA